MKRRDLEENPMEFISQMDHRNYEGVRLASFRSLVLLWLGDKRVYQMSNVGCCMDDVIVSTIDNEVSPRLRYIFILYTIICAIHLNRTSAVLMRSWARWLLHAAATCDIRLLHALQHYYMSLRESYLKYETATADMEVVDVEVEIPADELQYLTSTAPLGKAVEEEDVDIMSSSETSSSSIELSDDDD